MYLLFLRAKMHILLKVQLANFEKKFLRKNKEIPLFCLLNSTFYYKISIKVVESGTKWLEVVNKSLSVAATLRRVIGYVHGRI